MKIRVRTFCNAGAKTIGQFLFAFAMSILFVATTQGQIDRSLTDGSMPSGFAPGAAAGSYPLSDIDTINVYNGNVNFHLPLLEIGGRGDAAAAFMFKIDTKNWLVKHHDYEINGTPATSNIPTFQHSQGPSGYGPGALGGRHVGGLFTTNCQAPGGGVYP